MDTNVLAMSDIAGISVLALSVVIVALFVYVLKNSNSDDGRDIKAVRIMVLMSCVTAGLIVAGAIFAYGENSQEELKSDPVVSSANTSQNAIQ